MILVSAILLAGLAAAPAPAQSEIDALKTAVLELADERDALRIEIADLKAELGWCAEDNLVSVEIIERQQEHIDRLRRAGKWKTTREWLRIGVAFGGGYVIGDR